MQDGESGFVHLVAFVQDQDRLPQLETVPGSDGNQYNWAVAHQTACIGRGKGVLAQREKQLDEQASGWRDWRRSRLVSSRLSQLVCLCAGPVCRLSHN
jgi:hypothetical protein